MIGGVSVDVFITSRCSLLYFELDFGYVYVVANMKAQESFTLGAYVLLHGCLASPAQ